MVVWASGLLVWWLLLFLRGRVALTAPFHAAWPVWVAALLWLLLLSVQILPLPVEWVALLSPAAAGYWQGLEKMGAEPGYVTLSLVPFLTTGFLLRSIAFLAIFCLTLLLARRRRRIRLLLMVLVVSGTAQAVYGSLMVMSGLEWGFFLEKEGYRGVATGTFINRNHLAGYLEMCLAAGIGLLMMDLSGSEAHNWRQCLRNLAQLLLSAKMRLRIALAIMVIGLVMTHSRMGNTAFFFSLILAGGVWFALSGRRPNRSVLILLVSLFVIDLYIVGAWFGVDKVVQRLESTSVDRETRDEVVRDGLDYWREFPLIGSGGGTFGDTFPGFREGDVKGYYNYAHNDYLQFLVETGAVGLALLGWMVVASLVAALMAIRRRRDPVMLGLGFAGVMGISAILIHSTVDFNLQIPANAALFMIILALSWVAVSFDRRQIGSN